MGRRMARAEKQKFDGDGDGSTGHMNTVWCWSIHYITGNIYIEIDRERGSTHECNELNAHTRVVTKL